MDPRQSIRQARDAGLSPEARPAPPPPPPPPPRNRPPQAEPVPPRQPVRSRPGAATPAKDKENPKPTSPPAAPGDSQRRLPGTPRGRRQVIVVNLPARAYALATDRGPSLGEAVLDAIESSHAWLIDTYATPEGLGEGKLFVRHRAPQSRRGLENPRATQLSFDPDDAQVLSTLRAQLNMSMSELVTTALERAFGRSSPLAPATR